MDFKKQKKKIIDKLRLRIKKNRASAEDMDMYVVLSGKTLPFYSRSETDARKASEATRLLREKEKQKEKLRKHIKRAQTLAKRADDKRAFRAAAAAARQASEKTELLRDKEKEKEMVRNRIKRGCSTEHDQLIFLALGNSPKRELPKLETAKEKELRRLCDGIRQNLRRSAKTFNHKDAEKFLLLHAKRRSRHGWKYESAAQRAKRCLCRRSFQIMAEYRKFLMRLKRGGRNCQGKKRNQAKKMLAKLKATNRRQWWLLETEEKRMERLGKKKQKYLELFVATRNATSTKLLDLLWEKAHSRGHCIHTGSNFHCLNKHPSLKSNVNGQKCSACSHLRREAVHVGTVATAGRLPKKNMELQAQLWAPTRSFLTRIAKNVGSCNSLEAEE